MLKRKAKMSTVASMSTEKTMSAQSHQWKINSYSHVRLRWPNPRRSMALAMSSLGLGILFLANW